MPSGAAYLLGIVIIGGGTILVYILFLWIEFKIIKWLGRNAYRYITKEEYKDDITYVNQKPYTVRDLLRNK